MRVELVATPKTQSVVLEKLPALIGPDSGAETEREAPIEGNYHCLLSRVDDHLIVWNLGSGGSTFVNGTRVSKASLRAGDTLRLGGTDFSVKYEQSPRRYLYGLRC